MTKLTPKHIAWFLPIAYLIHLLDEYFSGAGFFNWFSNMFNSGLSSNDFIIINSIGFTFTVIAVILYSLNKASNFIIAVLGSLFFINGLIHPAASILTATYSPGTISGVLVYLPLGFLIYKKIFPLLSEEQRALSVVAGTVVQIIVAIIALNI